MSRRVVIVEDEQDIAELVALHLEREGCRTAIYGDGESGLEAVQASPPNLVILDLMLPGRDGFEVCREIRRHSELDQVPILILSARGEEIDRVAGLELGADDYLDKPFAPRVLVARARRLMRTPPEAPSTGKPLTVGPITIDPERHEARADGQLLELTRTEFGILRLLAARPGRVRARSEILSDVSGSAALDRTVDVHIASLRRKLGVHGGLIQTVRGVGYRLDV
ncbi:MAG: response regulator transcription factor [Planctomycetota bacterium]